MEFSRPEYWSGQAFPSPGDLPKPGIEPRSPTLQADSLPAEPQGKPVAIQSRLKLWKPLKILFSFFKCCLTPNYPLFSYQENTYPLTQIIQKCMQIWSCTGNCIHLAAWLSRNWKHVNISSNHLPQFHLTVKSVLSKHSQ